MKSKVAADNAAWALVIERETGVKNWSEREIGTLTGASLHKVWAMVSRFRSMKRADIKPSGDWWQDRVVIKIPAAPRHPATTPTAPATI